MITGQDALCCLLDAVVASAADASAEPFDHVYPTSAMTWPYCDHDAVIGRVESISTNPPPNRQYQVAENPQTTGTVRYHRFDLHVIRCGPPIPDEHSTQCLGDIYGDCTSPADHSTLAGHHRALDLETERLFAELLDRWCDCLVAGSSGAEYSKTRPRWIEQAVIMNQGRFSAMAFQVGTLLA